MQLYTKSNMLRLVDGVAAGWLRLKHRGEFQTYSTKAMCNMSEGKTVARLCS